MDRTLSLGFSPQPTNSCRTVLQRPCRARQGSVMTAPADHPLMLAADALEREANYPRNKKYRHAYLLAAAHYRQEAVRLPEMQALVGGT